MKPMIAAALGQKPDRHPVWFLRQAGRYLPEYREIRKNNDFLTVCKTPELASEVTLQPLRRFDLDGAIIFSDILVTPVAMGQGLTFGKGHGPILDNPIRTAADLKRLTVPTAKDSLSYVGAAIRETKKQLKDHQTMIGFAGAPITVAAYMIEGGGSKDHAHVKSMAWNDPNTLNQLQEMLAELTIDYCKLQVEAGAEIIMLFDTWAGLFKAEDYQKLVWPWVAKIASGVKSATNVPIIYYPGQSPVIFASLKPEESIDVLAVDWRMDFASSIKGLEKSGWNVSVQGNLDPTLLLGPKQLMQQKTREILEAGRSARGHIFNVGHGLIPSVPPESLSWVIEEVRKSKP